MRLDSWARKRRSISGLIAALVLISFSTRCSALSGQTGSFDVVSLLLLAIAFGGATLGCIFLTNFLKAWGREKVPGVLTCSTVLILGSFIFGVGCRLVAGPDRADGRSPAALHSKIPPKMPINDKVPRRKGIP